MMMMMIDGQTLEDRDSPSVSRSTARLWKIATHPLCPDRRPDSGRSRLTLCVQIDGQTLEGRDSPSVSRCCNFNVQTV